MDPEHPGKDPSGAEPSGPDALLDEALAGLSREIRSRVAGTDVEGIDWFGLFDELRERTRMLGMRERSGETDEFGMDPELLRRARPLFQALCESYFRVEVSGLGAVPEGPVLFVANRSGLLPYDGLVLAHIVAEARGEEARPRPLVADWLITLPFAQPTLTRLGAVRACRENAERLLRSGRSVAAFPEGLKGAGKVFRDRYRLQRFGRGGVVRLGLETGLPIVPVAIVGAEEAHPVLFKVESLARAVGLPFVPVTPTFPWLGPLGALPLPARWSIRFGDPVDVGALGAGMTDDELLVSRLNERLRATIQAMVDTGRRARSGVFR